ncbi:MAG TPA: hypothetical protein VF177_12425, partial [Anaerolineae bacterium]
YDFVVIDTSAYLSDVALALLDAADRIVLVTQQNLASLKNVSRFFDLTESLNYEPQKVWLVVNHTSNKQGISVKDISDTLKRPIVMTIPEDDAAANAAADRGIPLVTGANQKRPVSVALTNLADHATQELVTGRVTAGKVSSPEKSIGFFGRLFGRRARAGG